jgi:hypothetical protein
MDPFLEDQAWADFHQSFIAEIRRHLVPQLRPKYVPRIEERVYIDHSPDSPPTVIRPDVSIVAGALERPAKSGGASTTVEPVVVDLPIGEEQHETYIAIYTADSLEIVTVLELLSPANKRRGSTGRREYLQKREALIAAGVNLVELDLLRGGERLPTVQPIPPADYNAFVCRAARGPRADLYAWRLPQPLPAIPIPLLPGDTEATLDLAAAFSAVYDSAPYDYAIDYARPLEVPLDPMGQTCVNEALARRRPAEE